MVANETISFVTVLNIPTKPRQFLGYLISHAMKGTSIRLIDNFKQAGYDVSKPQWFIMIRCAHSEGKSTASKRGGRHDDG